MPKFSGPRAAALHECLMLDMAEAADGFRRAAEQMKRLSPILECIALDLAELDLLFERGDVHRG